MSVTHGSAGELKKGSYVVIDGEPCEVLSVSKSKPGKHGSAKVRVEARGLFDGTRRSKIYPADATVEIPIVDKRSGQIISVSGNTIQVMDLETFEVFEVPIPEEIAGEISSGAEVEYWVSMGKKRVVRVKGQ
ncbi:MAG: translation initiation factor IF-5A [Thermoproteota archaeon]|uniref:Translation initiation factor 5A n=1 Tax=Candidatus Methanodesulfokora washburnensis TaxID=2478471 RepID=A0A3R9X5Y2_9CREN|nr:translation initiation factor IF-5A [Candidatus Methanodesulfokores washburnensis]RSN76181.1 translation initiation factor IF-5A [Candidatus Methanodesulfokores washburnensis]RZN59677.1 MAG: translation initiation factor IF-5A [Candidatus Methanodesulfokores washburnensis]TDA41123.1 MAG: translation initiation factor IF-5A [Candidatus Korarchaeota archaeon]